MKHKFSTTDALLLITAFIWGWSFIIIKWALASIDPYFFVFIRFTVALVALVIAFRAKIKEHWHNCLKPGISLGLLLGLAFLTQTIGLKYTTASASSFITGLNVVLVTVFAALLLRKLPQWPVLIGVTAASAGLLLITFRGRLEFQAGDLLTLACAVLYALHLVYTEKHAKNCSASILTLIQFATVTVLAGLAFLGFGHQELPLIRFSPLHWLAILFCGLVSTALAYLFQTKAQQQIPPFRTAIILATEPLFTGIFAIGLRMDPFDWKVVAGGLLIFAGMILTAWDERGKN